MYPRFCGNYVKITQNILSKLRLCIYEDFQYIFHLIFFPFCQSMSFNYWLLLNIYPNCINVQHRIELLIFQYLRPVQFLISADFHISAFWQPVSHRKIDCNYIVHIITKSL